MNRTLHAIAILVLPGSMAFGQARNVPDDRAIGTSGNPVSATRSFDGASIGNPGYAQALVWYTDRPTFQANAIGPLCNSEDFECAAPAPIFTHSEPLWIGTNDAAVATGCIEGGLSLSSSSGGGVVTVDGLIGPTVVSGANIDTDWTNLDFCNEPRSVGFDIRGAIPDLVEVRVYDCNNNLLGMMSFSVNDNLPGTFAGVVSPPGMPVIWRIEVESLVSMNEVVDDLEWDGWCNPILSAKKYVTSGDLVTLAVSKAHPQSKGLLFVTCVNGAPLLLAVPPPFAVPGTAFLGPFPTPTIAPGITVGLNVFLSDPVNGITVTNKKTLFFQ